MNNFINLHTNSEYSFLESTIRIDDLIQLAIKNKQDTIAITEHNSLFSMAYFIEQCQKYNIKAIIGIDLDVEDSRIILLPRNRKGLLFINQLSLRVSKGETIKFDELDSIDLFYLDHPRFGYYKKYFTIPGAIHKNLFFYNSDNEKDSHAIVLKENITLSEDDNILLQVVRDVKGLNLNYKGSNFTFTENVNSIISDRTNLIAKQCILDDIHDSFKLPEFKNPKKLPSFDYLKSITVEKLSHMAREFYDFNEAKNRLFAELKVIKDLGFADYFLIIQDLIAWSKSQGIEIGPGRGSAAGSLVSYLLNITEINPLKYGLLFERFLNSARATMPDIDIDIQDNRRAEVLEYVYNKYGSEHFGLITTFQTLGVKSALRDVSRTMNLDLSIVNALSKFIPATKSAAEALNLKEVKKYISVLDTSTQKLVEKIFELVAKLESRPRQISSHAAGIVLSDRKLIEKVPLWINDAATFYPQTQISMEYLESYGLLKIDLLGLKNLTIINDVEKMLKEKGIENTFDIYKNDLPTFTMLNNGLTSGIFQLESPGMTKTLKNVHVTRFSDLYDIISLYRPGPMKYIQTYIDNKNSPKHSGINPVYDEILSETHGVIIYQEQIMEICQKVSKMTLSEADLFRRAISKKKHDELKQLKSKFVEGALKNGYNESTANSIYSQIEEFADYGFNKSHAVSYAAIAYKMAYYKCHYPLYFYASLIDSFIVSQEKANQYIQEAQRQGYIIQSPSIEYCEDNVLIREKDLIMPLRYINGLGSVAINSLKEITKNKENVKTLAYFLAECKVRRFSEANLTKLIESNSLRKFGNIVSITSATNTFYNEVKNSDPSFFKTNIDNTDVSKWPNRFKEELNALLEVPQLEEDLESFKKYQNKYFKHQFDTELQKELFKYSNEIYCEDFRPNVAYRIIIEIKSIKNLNKAGNILKLIEFFDGQTSSTFWATSEKEYFERFETNKYYEVEMIMSNMRKYRISKVLGEK